jgi:hypothetical protein
MARLGFLPVLRSMKNRYTDLMVQELEGVKKGSTSGYPGEILSCA